MLRLRYLALIGVFGALMLTTTPALAQVSGSDTPVTTPSTVEVGGVTEEQGTPVDPGYTGDPGDPGVLPFTGGDIAGFVALGALTTIIGGVMVSRARSQSRLRNA